MQVLLLLAWSGSNQPAVIDLLNQFGDHEVSKTTLQELAHVAREPLDACVADEDLNKAATTLAREQSGNAFVARLQHICALPLLASPRFSQHARDSLAMERNERQRQAQEERAGNEASKVRPNQHLSSTTSDAASAANMRRREDGDGLTSLAVRLRQASDNARVEWTVHEKSMEKRRSRAALETAAAARTGALMTSDAHIDGLLKLLQERAPNVVASFDDSEKQEVQLRRFDATVRTHCEAVVEYCIASLEHEHLCNTLMEWILQTLVFPDVHQRERAREIEREEREALAAMSAAEQERLKREWECMQAEDAASSAVHKREREGQRRERAQMEANDKEAVRRAFKALPKAKRRTLLLQEQEWDRRMAEKRRQRVQQHLNAQKKEKGQQKQTQRLMNQEREKKLGKDEKEESEARSATGDTYQQQQYSQGHGESGTYPWMYVSDDNDNWYWCNVDTGESQWEDPFAQARTGNDEYGAAQYTFADQSAIWVTSDTRTAQHEFAFQAHGQAGFDHQEHGGGHDQQALHHAAGADFYDHYQQHDQVLSNEYLQQQYDQLYDDAGYYYQQDGTGNSYHQ